MSKKPSAKQLVRHMVRRVMTTEGNMMQWALVDHHLGEELKLRAEQVKAIIDGDITKSTKVHDERIECLKKALDELQRCPGCDDHPKPKEEE